MPVEAMFLADGPVLTVLGPRSREWVRRAADDPRIAIDIFPWWERGWSPRHDLNLALVLMWVELTWARPRLRVQRDALVRTLSLLRSAHAADPALPMPWAEWAELLDILDRSEPGDLRDLGWSDDPDDPDPHDHSPELAHQELIDPPLAALVRNRARSSVPAIGFRRHDVVHHGLPGGWTIRVPGSLTCAIEDDGGTWVAFDDSRDVHFSSMTITPGPGHTHPTLDELVVGSDDLHSDPPASSRPTRWSDESGSGHIQFSSEVGEDGQRVLVASATILQGTALGFCTVAFQSTEDRDWAVEVCKSCRLMGRFAEP